MNTCLVAVQLGFLLNMEEILLLLIVLYICRKATYKGHYSNGQDSRP